MTDGPEGEMGGVVLVVDDEPDVRRVAVMMLRRGGYEAVEARDGVEAVDILRARGHEIDVVLLDVMMPRMTGHEALPAIRELAPRMPVVFFSGYDRGEVLQHLDGASTHTAFLPKPFDKASLLAAVGAAFSASGPRANGTG